MDVLEAARLYDEHLDSESEIAAIAERADEDVTAGRYVTVASADDSEPRHREAMARLHARLAGDAGAR